MPANARTSARIAARYLQTKTPLWADAMHVLPAEQSALVLHVVVEQRFESMKIALGAHFCTQEPDSHAWFTAQSSVVRQPPLPAAADAGGAAPADALADGAPCAQNSSGRASPSTVEPSASTSPGPHGGPFSHVFSAP
jgi:hypothetical protein